MMRFMVKRTSSFLENRAKHKDDLKKPIDDERLELVNDGEYFYYVIEFDDLNELVEFIDNLETSEVVINMKDVILGESYIEIYDTYREWFNN